MELKNNLKFILFGILLSTLTFSCSSEKDEVDESSPESTLISLIDAINGKNNEIVESIIVGNFYLDILQISNENSNFNFKIDTLEFLNADSLDVKARVKLSQLEVDRIVKIFDKKILFIEQNQKWKIKDIKDFYYGKPIEISENEALKLVYGLPQNNDLGVWSNNSIIREPIKSHRIKNNYLLLSISQEGEWKGYGTEQYVNGAILNWNGIKWVLKEKADSIMTFYDSNHGGIYVYEANLIKDNSFFFLLKEYQETEVELINNLTFLDQNLKVFYNHNHIRKYNPMFAGGDGSVEDKPINLPESFRFTTYKYGFENVIKNNLNLRKRILFDENDQPIHMEYWYNDRDEIMSEGGVIQDPSNNRIVLYDGYWYDKRTGFKGEYNKGRLVNSNIVDISKSLRLQENFEKCQWCKFGVIVNGYCDMCGSLSQSTRNELNDEINKRNTNSNSLSCLNKVMHRTIRYPYECPYCGYVGQFK